VPAPKRPASLRSQSDNFICLGIYYYSGLFARQESVHAGSSFASLSKGSYKKFYRLR